MPNGHGGSRQGAGRKTHARTLKSRALSREIRDEAAAKGIPMPLDIMLEAIGAVYRKKGAKGGAIGAFKMALDAAPYLHPRLQSVDANVSGELTIEIVRFSDKP